jgi:hypothetical protein
MTTLDYTHVDNVFVGQRLVGFVVLCVLEEHLQQAQIRIRINN